MQPRRFEKKANMRALCHEIEQAAFPRYEPPRQIRLGVARISGSRILCLTSRIVVRFTQIDTFVADDHGMAGVKSIDGQYELARRGNGQYGRIEAMHWPFCNSNPIIRNKD